MRLGRVLLVGACVLGAACKGDSNTDSAVASSTTNSTTTTIALTTSSTAPSSTTSTTAPTQVKGKTLDATTTTTAAANPQTAGVTTSEAPREPTTDRSDNTGTFTFGPNARSATTPPAANPKDPLTFTVSCRPDPDGHGNCHVEFTNHVDRTAQFPGGLKITVTMRRNGGNPIAFELVPPGVSSLAPGERAIVDGTFDITEPGDYEYDATTTVHWP